MAGGVDWMHIVRLGVALSFVGTFLVSVGVSIATGSEPSIELAAPTMFVLAWLYRATKAGDDEA